MRISKTILISIGAAIFCTVIILLIMKVNYKNEQTRLVNQYDMQLSKIEGVHDNMWKVLESKAGVTKEYASQFDSIYNHIMSKRYDQNDKVLFNWIKEQNPEFSNELYKDLSVTIEVQRRQFLNAQLEIIDIVRVHNNLVQTFPSSLFVENKMLKYEMISSTYTKGIMENKVEDGKVDLFKK
jgi:hypothetical protein